MTQIEHAASDASTRTAIVARPLLLARWLMAVAWVIVVMVVIGRITRLTESGLSITEWKPVTGALPPLNEAQWMKEFEAYKQIGEYQQVAGPAGMTLDDYKFIYFWEWFHRLLGRFIGLIYALPLAWFWFKGFIPAGYKWRLTALLALGGLQGTFGWYMVRSGLSTEMTDVSHFWLSIHLLTALFTLAGLVWMVKSSWGFLKSLLVGFLLANLLLAAVVSIWALFSFEALMGVLWFFGKSFGLVPLFVMMRATYPRVRIDQMMNFAWKWLMPAALLNIFITAGAIIIVKELGA